HLTFFSSSTQPPPRSTLFPYTTLFRSLQEEVEIRMRIHAQPVLTLFSVHIKGIFLIISRRCHNHRKSRILQVFRKLQRNLIGMRSEERRVGKECRYRG